MKILNRSRHNLFNRMVKGGARISIPDHLQDAKRTVRGGIGLRLLEPATSILIFSTGVVRAPPTISPLKFVNRGRKRSIQREEFGLGPELIRGDYIGR